MRWISLAYYSFIFLALTLVLSAKDDNKIINKIVPCLQSNNANICAAAIGILGKSKDYLIINKIIPFIQNDNNIVSYTAINTIEKISDNKILEKILIDLPDELKIRITTKVEKTGREYNIKNNSDILELSQEVDDNINCEKDNYIIDKLVDKFVQGSNDYSDLGMQARIEASMKLEDIIIKLPKPYDTKLLEKLIPFFSSKDISLVWSVFNIFNVVFCPEIIQKISPFLRCRFNEYIWMFMGEGNDDFVKGFYWHCLKIISYSDFFYASLNQPLLKENKKIQSTKLKLKATNKFFPLLIDISALERETDTTIIAQEICNEIYSIELPELTPYLEENIPENIDNWSKLKTKLANIKRKLPQDRLAIIFEQCDPHEELIQFCSKLTKIIDIGWITDKPINNPKIRTFSPESTDLQSAINVWLEQLADGM